MINSRYVCFEGVDGVGKTTQIDKVYEYLTKKGFSVLKTKEPGSSIAPTTLQLRSLMLDSKYKNEISSRSRELISQAIRSIHIDTIKKESSGYDFILQDRGILSALSYGEASKMKEMDLKYLNDFSCSQDYDSLYDDIIYLRGSPEQSLEKALSAKQEFEQGDVIESYGSDFMTKVQKNMDRYSKEFNTHVIDICDKNIDEVFIDIVKALQI